MRTFVPSSREGRSWALWSAVEVRSVLGSCGFQRNASNPDRAGGPWSKPTLAGRMATGGARGLGPQGCRGEAGRPGSDKPQGAWWPGALQAPTQLSIGTPGVVGGGLAGCRQAWAGKASCHQRSQSRPARSQRRSGGVLSVIKHSNPTRGHFGKVAFPAGTRIPRRGRTGEIRKEGKTEAGGGGGGHMETEAGAQGQPRPL